MSSLLDRLHGVMEKCLTFLLLIADRWYATQDDALSLLKQIGETEKEAQQCATVLRLLDNKNKRRLQHNALHIELEQDIDADEEGDGQGDHEVERDTVTEDFKRVYDMFRCVGFTEDQAVMAVLVMATGENVTDEERGKLCQMYEHMRVIKPFAENGSILPLEGAQNIYNTDLQQKQVAFSYVFSRCLPLSRKPHDLEKHLAEILTQIGQQKAKQNLMNASGVLGPFQGNPLSLKKDPATVPLTQTVLQPLRSPTGKVIARKEVKSRTCLDSSSKQFPILPEQPMAL